MPSEPARRHVATVYAAGCEPGRVVELPQVYCDECSPVKRQSGPSAAPETVPISPKVERGDAEIGPTADKSGPTSHPWYCDLCNAKGVGDRAALIQHCASAHDGEPWCIHGGRVVLRHMDDEPTPATHALDELDHGVVAWLNDALMLALADGARVELQYAGAGRGYEVRIRHAGELVAVAEQLPLQALRAALEQFTHGRVFR